MGEQHQIRTKFPLDDINNEAIRLVVGVVKVGEGAGEGKEPRTWLADMIPAAICVMATQNSPSIRESRNSPEPPNLPRWSKIQTKVAHCMYTVLTRLINPQLSA